MKIFVINLERDVQRREFMAGQLARDQLTAEFVPAVYGASLSEEERARLYSDRWAKIHRARSLVPAEIGCALSHLKVYEAMVLHEVPWALVLEDDVVIPPEMKAVLENCQPFLNVATPTVILLSPAEGVESKGANPVGTSHRLLQFKSGYFTSSYLLNHAAALALGKELAPVSDVADCWKRLDGYKVIDLLVLSPTLIEQDQMAFGSSTTADYHSVVGFNSRTWFAYKFRRVFSVVWNIFYSRYRRWLKRYAGLRIGSMR